MTWDARVVLFIGATSTTVATAHYSQQVWLCNYCCPYWYVVTDRKYSHMMHRQQLGARIKIVLRKMAELKSEASVI